MDQQFEERQEKLTGLPAEITAPHQANARSSESNLMWLA